MQKIVRESSQIVLFSFAVDEDAKRSRASFEMASITERLDSVKRWWHGVLFRYYGALEGPVTFVSFRMKHIK